MPVLEPLETYPIGVDVVQRILGASNYHFRPLGYSSERGHWIPPGSQLPAAYTERDIIKLVNADQDGMDEYHAQIRTMLGLHPPE